MKTKRIVLLLSALVLLTVSVSGCRFGMHSGTKGSGKRQTQKREIPNFTSISTNGAFDIQVVAQKEPSLEIEGDDNILPLVETEVSNNVLHIRSKENYSIDTEITVKISVPNLEGVSVSGAGNLDVTNLKNEKFAIDLNGAPEIRVTGETKNLEIETNGAGKIDTTKLRAASVEVESNGVSKVQVYAGDKLDVTISGPSHVIYVGDPEVNQTINGPGTLEKRESEGAWMYIRQARA